MLTAAVMTVYNTVKPPNTAALGAGGVQKMVIFGVTIHLNLV